MPYKLFLSHAHEDNELAGAIAAVINDAFEGAIEIWLAKDRVLTSAHWKEEIVKQLKDRAGVILLLTGQSVGKPWLIVEWAAFWIQEPARNIYILLADDVKQSNLVAPMLDVQAALLTNSSHMGNFFRALKEHSSFRLVPYQYAEKLATRAKQMLTEQRSAILNRHKIDIEAGDVNRLPSDTTGKLALIEYLLQQDQLTVVERYLAILDLPTKVALVHRLIDRRTSTHLALVCKYIFHAPYIADAVIALMRQGCDEVSEFTPLLDEIGYRDESVLTACCYELISARREDGAIFRNIYNRLTNNAERRKIGKKLIEAGRSDSAILTDIIETLALNNRRELTKLGFDLLAVAHPSRDNQLERILVHLRTHNSAEYVKLSAMVDEAKPQSPIEPPDAS